MTNASDLQKSQTVEIDGYVVTRGCLFHAESGKWQPVASVGDDWDEARHRAIVATKADFQDTPEQALDKADTLAREWIRSSGSPSDA